MNALLAPLFGLIGILIGISLNELLRRKNRIEQYAPAVFERRLKAYEELASLINDGSSVASEIIDDASLTGEQRHAMISAIIMPIAEFADRNKLYIDEELGAHCTALFMGVEDIQDLDGEKKKEALTYFYQMRVETYRMIREDSGVSELNKLFRTINRPTLSGPIIERIRHLKAEKKRDIK